MTYQPNSQIDPRLLVMILKIIKQYRYIRLVLIGFVRFKRHFTLIYLPLQSGSALKSIFHGTLEASMFYNERSGLEAELHTALVDASCSLLDAVNQVLKPCPMPGRQHYMFNMKSIITILQVSYFECNNFNVNERIVYFTYFPLNLGST